MRHTCVGSLTIIDSHNDLSPDQRQAIIGTNAWLLSMGSFVAKLREIFIKIHIFPLKNAFENVIRKKAAIASRP